MVTGNERIALSHARAQFAVIKSEPISQINNKP
jgi:hypothetical protein